MDDNCDLIEKAEIGIIVETEIVDPKEEILYDYEVYDEKNNVNNVNNVDTLELPEVETQELPTSFNLFVCINNTFYNLIKASKNCFSCCCKLKSENLLT
jgi:hypothetical protein